MSIMDDSLASTGLTCLIKLRGETRQMQLLSKLSKLISGEEPQPSPSESDDRLATRPMQPPRDHDATRPSYRISDEKWLKIQKAIDQAG